MRKDTLHQYTFWKSAAILQIFIAFFLASIALRYLALVSVDRCYRNFREFRQKLERREYLKRYYLFPKTFHRDEPFHLNYPRNYHTFYSDGKRSRFEFINSWDALLVFFLVSLLPVTVPHPLQAHFYISRVRLVVPVSSLSRNTSRK